MDYLMIITKLLLGFVGLLIIMRLLGKKELSQVTPFDVVYGVVFGGIVEESLYDQKISITHMLFGIFCWGLIIYIVEVITRKSNFLRNLLKGKPAYIIVDGKFNYKELKKNKMEMEQLRSLMRMQGVFTLKEVKDLILEPGGQVSIRKYEKYDSTTPDQLNLQIEDEPLNYLLINNGKVNDEDLNMIHKDKDWLMKQLRKEGISNIENVSYAEWNERDGLLVKKF